MDFQKFIINCVIFFLIWLEDYCEIRSDKSEKNILLLEEIVIEASQDDVQKAVGVYACTAHNVSASWS